jgi:transcription initiation factor IIF auxiliary subunit
MLAGLEIAQSEEYESDDWWKWSVWLEGADDDLDRIEFVDWVLHPTFPHPIRREANRANKFGLTTGGWGVFTIVAKVQFKNGDQQTLRHQLQLHYPDGGPNTK